MSPKTKRLTVLFSVLVALWASGVIVAVLIARHHNVHGFPLFFAGMLGAAASSAVPSMLLLPFRTARAVRDIRRGARGEWLEQSRRPR